ncbi:MAG: 50S ribosomal protein L25 [Kiritimatiellia bacterium]
MAKEIKIKAEHRQEQGSGAVRRLRRKGLVPAAMTRIAGGSTMLQVNAHEFENMLRHHSSNQFVVTVEIDGQDLPALLREVQSDVMTGHAIHADFGEISLTRKLRVSIGLRLGGEPEGVKNEGGILEQTLRQIEVECLPGDIVEFFTVDVSALKLGQSLAVRDLNLSAGYHVLTHSDVAVATIVEMAAEEVAATAAPVEGAVSAGEPDVITKGKKEEGEEAEAAAGDKKAGAGGDKKGAAPAGGDKKGAASAGGDKKK